MPPAVSDDEMDSDGLEQVPAKATPVKPPAEEVEEDEEDEEEPDEYQVEKIVKHDFDKDGNVLYQIKWLGYDKKSDYTWEPVENLESAQEVLEEYHTKIGGVPGFESAPKKKGGKAGNKRSSSAAKLDSPQVTTSSKKSKHKSGGAEITNGEPESNPKDLPDGTWEHLVTVSSLIEVPNAALKGYKGKGPRLKALLVWEGTERKTQHPLDVARRKCPQKLLDYYEQHLVFKQPAPT